VTGGGFDASVDDATGRITVVGSVDDAERFSEIVMSRVEVPDTATTIDLSAVTFFPSAALTVLVRARKAARGAAHSLRVTSEDGSIAARVLQVSGFPATATGAGS
jgi:anti-anti-sigma factor